MPRKLKKNGARIIREFKSKRIFGELEYFPHQIAFGASIRYLTCKGMGWLFRIYFGPIKIWFNLKPKKKPVQNGKCRQCGRCCSPIRLSKKITPGLIPDSAPEGWMQEHWHLIGKKNKHYLYRCDFYDTKTHLCKIHKTKPNVCKNFPYEKEHPDDFEKYTLEECGYRTNKRTEI